MGIDGGLMVIFMGFNGDITWYNHHNAAVMALKTVMIHWLKKPHLNDMVHQFQKL